MEWLDFVSRHLWLVEPIPHVPFLPGTTNNLSLSFLMYSYGSNLQTLFVFGLLLCPQGYITVAWGYGWASRMQGQWWQPAAAAFLGTSPYPFTLELVAVAPCTQPYLHHYYVSSIVSCLTIATIRQLGNMHYTLQSFSVTVFSVFHILLLVWTYTHEKDVCLPNPRNLWRSFPSILVTLAWINGSRTPIKLLMLMILCAIWQCEKLRPLKGLYTLNSTRVVRRAVFDTVSALPGILWYPWKS